MTINGRFVIEQIYIPSPKCLGGGGDPLGDHATSDDEAKSTVRLNSGRKSVSETSSNQGNKNIRRTWPSSLRGRRGPG